MPTRPSHLPMRLISGAFILNSGLSKRNPDPETAAYLHSEASRAFPMLKDMDPQDFTRILSNGELAVGTVLLLPFVPSSVAGAALTGFSSGLLRLYFTNPDARMDDGIRPTPQGIPMAKDSWLLGIGLGLLLDGLKPKPMRRRKRRKG
ncbi:hypothetical protein HDA32_000436 [Spinactinospora alkalitolerans]|uniref:DoxX family protein n=1 Tax=Spinactinospora alkalitolerans TaxID=687207 RepID=A0A852TM33_9ACTN|nr:hypothetical protein [Spinactinospora alkalitolerans]NYE45316.1 hypothetical protein [Spinactinospora alkalitolerans]